jgi:8-oxo-dGTP pyrophosphatase MutT (NUDIX family)
MICLKWKEKGGIKMEKETSAGAVIFRKGRETEYLLVYGGWKKAWGFPKGHIESDEPIIKAAEREIAEEVGLKGLKLIDGFMEELMYNTISNRGANNGKEIEKTVYYFLAEAISQDVKVDGNEITDYRWVTRAEANKLLVFDNTRALLNKAADLVESIRTGCHILGLEEPGKILGPNGDLKVVENIYESSHFDLTLHACTKCGQLYLGCFLEIIDWSGGDDDCWNFWAPISKVEADAVKASKLNVGELIQSRRHITWHPDGKIYWTSGPEIALIRGPG